MLRHKNLPQKLGAICIKEKKSNDFKNIISLERLIFLNFLNMLILVSNAAFRTVKCCQFSFSLFQKKWFKAKTIRYSRKNVFLKIWYFEWIFTTPILFCFANFFCCNVLFDTKRQKSKKCYSQIKKNITSTINLSIFIKKLPIARFLAFQRGTDSTIK